MSVCINIFDDIDSDLLKQVYDTTKSLKDDDKVNLYIASYGGEILVGMGIIDLLKRFNTTAYIIGYACSAAAIIALSCKTINMSEHSLMMLHSAWCDGVSTEDTAIQRCNENQLKIIKTRCPQYSEEMLINDRWLRPSECLALGLVDNINNVVADEYVALADKFAAKVKSILNEKEVDMEDKKELLEEIKDDSEVQVEEIVEEKPEEISAEEVEEKRDLIDVVEKLAEKVADLEARLKALEEPVKAEVEVSDNSECSDERINNLYKAICKPVASIPVVCASSKTVCTVSKGFEAYTKI